MLKRYRITKDCTTGFYVVLDRLKAKTCLVDKRACVHYFMTKEEAQGWVYGRTGDKRYVSI